jgi:hypothetical protein
MVDGARKRASIAVPLYNDKDGVEVFYESLTHHLDANLGMRSKWCVLTMEAATPPWTSCKQWSPGTHLNFAKIPSESRTRQD